MSIWAKKMPLGRRLVLLGQGGQKGGMTGFRSFMDVALDEARAAGARGEVPVGAVVVGPDGVVVAQAGNRTREMCDPTAHAEVLAIRGACAVVGSERLVGYDLYVTLEPCPICAGAISAARIARLYYGAADPKSGGVAHGARVFSHAQCHHAPEVYEGIAAGEAEAILREFFAARR
jgi:tRNA(adenine34) deaminase